MIKKLSFSFITACLLLSSVAFAQTETGSTDTKHHKRFVYDVFYKNTKIGKINRDERRNNDRYYVSLSADLSFFFLSLGGYQNSTIEWQPENQWYKPVRFDRHTSGFENVKVSGSISDDSHHSQIVKEGKTLKFEQNDGPITELNAMFLQVREGLLAGKTKFDFHMQTSKKVDHYYFEVKGEETLDTRMGQLKTLRIEQTHVKDRSLKIWFSPKLDMQMVEFNYDRKIVHIRGTLHDFYHK